MNNGKIGRIILSKILEMPLEKYLTYIRKKTNLPKNGKCKLPQNGKHAKKDERKRKLVYARVFLNKGNLSFEITDPLLERMAPIDHRKIPGNEVVALKWINTRNMFSKHILCSLLDYQCNFWRSGKEADLRPLTLKGFLQLYPYRFLDHTRLSRILSSLLVEMPQSRLINLRMMFPSTKRCCAYRIEQIINYHEALLTDRDIQNELARQGVHISLRTVCNCRKLLGIPSYKRRNSHYYGKDIRFSDYVKLAKGQLSRIPSEAGVYELSIVNKIEYGRRRYDVLYIGSSKNIRKRVANYSGSKAKNIRLKVYVNGYDLFVRCFLTKNYVQVEKELLTDFKKTYGELPKANRLGG